MNETPAKYAIRVWFGDSFLYVSEGPIDDLRVFLLDTLEEAVAYANEWSIAGHEEMVEIVEYQP